MEQLTKNQAVATSQEAVQNQNEPQLRDENAHNDKSVHGVLNPTYQAGLRRDAVQPDIEAERKKREEIEAGSSYCSGHFGGATCDDKCAQTYARFDKNDWRIVPAEFYRFHDAEVNTIYTDIAGVTVLYGNLPPREISMKHVYRSGDSSTKFKIAEGQWYRYAPSYVSPAYHLLEGFPFIQEPPSGDLQERVLIRHHDYDQCFQSVQLLQWNSQVKFNVTVYRNLPTTRDSIMTS